MNNLTAPAGIVLVLHHDADLYGSDQSLLRTVRAMKAGGLTPVVVLPHDGPLVALIRAEGVELNIGPVGKVTRQLMRPAGLLRLARDLWTCVRFLSRVVAGRRVLLVYSNSVAVLGGGLWAKLHAVPRLWHVREIVVSPRLAVRGFPMMLAFMGGWCVCNSHATRSWITTEAPSLAARSSVIWNGLEAIDPPDPEAVAKLRAAHMIEADHVVVALVGRINRWKGQAVLIEAAALLRQQQRATLRFFIVGDVADGQIHYRETMLAQIGSACLEGHVFWLPFTREVDVVWAATDIAVVPSIEPEPFGRVAIEAMAHGVAVVASAHGGLAEIVEHGKTGLLVPPGNAPELADAIARLADSPALRKAYGRAGIARQQTHFSQAEHDRSLMALMRGLLAPGGAGNGASQ